MYQSPDDEGTMKSMGIVLKRRDNAPIVKTACSSFLDKLLVDLDVHGAVAAMCAVLDRVVEGRVTMDELTVSKTLRAEYKDRGRIAHAVLAARVGDRDPGNAPQINDRIQMVHVRLRPCDAMGALQGDKVETPEYVAEKGLDVDLEYYLADQIQNPAVQMLATVVDRLPPPATQPSQWAAREASLEAAVLADGRDSEETRERVNEIIRKEREAEARKLIFGPRLARLRNRYAQSAKASMIASMFRTHAGSRR
jgi:DNA polymerase family B